MMHDDNTNTPIYIIMLGVITKHSNKKCGNITRVYHTGNILVWI